MINKYFIEKNILIICEGNESNPGIDKKIISHLLIQNSIKFQLEDIVPIGGKCDFIKLIREGSISITHIKDCIMSALNNSKRNYSIKDLSSYDNIYFFFDKNASSYETNFTKTEIHLLKKLNINIVYSIPYLEADLGYKDKLDFKQKNSHSTRKHWKQQIKKDSNLVNYKVTILSFNDW